MIEIHRLCDQAPKSAFATLIVGLASVLAFSCALAAPASAPQGSTSIPEYRISPSDLLAISVWKEPDLQLEVSVRPDGGISIPLAGNVAAAGQTPAELQDRIKEQLEEYIPDPVVTVNVKEINGLKIYISGQVTKPGEYLVERYIDVMQAITLAGGLGAFANDSKIRILRRINGKEVVFNFNYGKVERGRHLEQNILLLPGDTVIVP